MSVTSAMDAIFAKNVQTTTAREFVRKAQDLSSQVNKTVSDMSAIAAEPKAAFGSLDGEFVSEAIAVQDVLTSFQTELAKHSEFLNWVEPA
jgi:hypothetical protein